ncbi:MAG: SIMPL domain-containing protein [Betaproteobacteria bacterium]
MRALATVIAATLLAAPAARAQEPSPSASATPVVVASGEAVVRRAPDRAVITATAEGRAKSPRDAQQQAATRAAAVLERLARLGIPKDALRTVAYDLHQEYETTASGRREPKEYVASNTLQITIDEVGRAGEILDGVVQAGASAVGGIGFGLKDRDAVEREAIRMAVADARSRAEAAAAGAGVTLGRIRRIESFKDAQSFAPRVAAGRIVEGVQVATPIEPGTIEVRAHVTLTVEIK